MGQPWGNDHENLVFLPTEIIWDLPGVPGFWRFRWPNHADDSGPNL